LALKSLIYLRVGILGSVHLNIAIRLSVPSA